MLSIGQLITRNGSTIIPGTLNSAADTTLTRVN